MTTSNRNISIVILVAVFLGFMAYYKFDFMQFPKSNSNYTHIYKIDTIFKFITRDSIKILHSKPKIKILYDTLRKIELLKVKLDTIIKHDTISVSYKYPENELDFLLKSAPDTLKTIQIAIPQQVDSEMWWQKPAAIFSGIIIGYFINDLRK